MLQTKHFIIGYTGTKAEIEALSTVATGSMALATDTDESGSYNGAAWDWNAVTSGTLAQFAATTSAQLAGVLSDETGTGKAVFADAPTFSAAPTIAPTSPTDGTDFLLFTLERAWRIQQALTAGNAMLEFFSDTAGKYTRINPNSNTAGGLIVADSMPTGTMERLMVEGTGDIKAQVSTLSTTGYAFFRLKNDAGTVANFGFFGSARAGTLFGLNQAGLFAMYGSLPMVVGTTDTNTLTLGQNNASRVTIGSLITNQVAVNYAADAQASDTYVITLAPALLAYSVGLEINFKANTANTGAATLNVNGLGAKTIVKGVSTTLANNDILAGMFCKVIYDGTNFVLFNPRTL